ncbi:MAG: TlpA disulfide reductase family protein [Deltaproteobacteria bacterium]
MKRTILTLALVGLVLAGAESGDAAENEKLKVGETAPSFTLKTMNPELSKKKRFALRDYVGNDTKTKKRAVVLSFAASYCVPCKKELAELKKLKGSLDGANVELAVVVIDTDPEGIAAMKKLTVDQLALEYPVLSDRFGVLARRYHANELPMTVIISPDGQVRWLSSGFAEGAIDKFKKAVGI